MSINHRLAITLCLGSLLAGCTVIADFDQFQSGAGGSGGGAVGGAGGATTTTAATGGTGGSGGSGGAAVGGAGGGSICAPVAAYTLEVGSAVSVPDACALADPGFDFMPSANELELESTNDPKMPFPFCFYGEEANTFWVGDNGYVTFGDAIPNALLATIGNPHSLDQPGLPAPGVLPFWDELRTSAAGVCVRVSEVAPFRRLWITWKGCFQADASCDAANSDLTFTVGVEETSNNVYVGYNSMTGTSGIFAQRASGLTATIGITNGDRNCSAAECGNDGLCADNSPCGYTQFSAQTQTTLETLAFKPAP